MSEDDLAEAMRVLRDEVLETAEHSGDPPGGEVFDAIIRALVVGGESVPGLDLQLHDAVTRRLAWGDSEESVLADAEAVFDRVMVAIERAFRDPEDRMVLIEAATQVAVTVARVVSLAAVARAQRDRAARLREEMAQRQLKDVLERQRASLVRMEFDTNEE